MFMVLQILPFPPFFQASLSSSFTLTLVSASRLVSECPMQPPTSSLLHFLAGPQPRKMSISPHCPAHSCPLANPLQASVGKQLSVPRTLLHKGLCAVLVSLNVTHPQPAGVTCPFYQGIGSLQILVWLWGLVLAVSPDLTPPPRRRETLRKHLLKKHQGVSDRSPKD